MNIESMGTARKMSTSEVVDTSKPIYVDFNKLTCSNTPPDEESDSGVDTTEEFKDIKVTRMASPEDEDDFLYTDESVVASLNRARDQMRQGKFVPKEDVLEDV